MEQISYQIFGENQVFLVHSLKFWEYIIDKKKKIWLAKINKNKLQENINLFYYLAHTSLLL